MMEKAKLWTKVILIWLSMNSVVECRWFKYRNTCSAIEKDPWSYEGSTNGPRKWGKTFPMCDGRQQSPINIYTDDVEDAYLKQLSLVNYDVPVTKAGVLNNGHTVEITPRDNTPRYIGIDGTKYSLRQFHFHWNKKRNAGTEHAIDDERFDMEAHFVHTSSQNQTAVVAVLLKAISGKNKAIQPIVDVLPRIRYRDDETVLSKGLKLDDLLPDNPSSFYRYKGSLTTPPCTEGVIWSILKECSDIGKEQLSQFYKLYAVPEDEATPECKINTNVRPLQPLYKRKVVSSM